MSRVPQELTVGPEVAAEVAWNWTEVEIHRSPIFPGILPRPGVMSEELNDEWKGF